MRLSLTMAGSLFQGEDEPDLDNAPASAVSFGTGRTTRILSSPPPSPTPRRRGRSKAAPDGPHPWVATTLTTPFRCSPGGQRSNSRADHVRREENVGGGGDWRRGGGASASHDPSERAGRRAPPPTAAGAARSYVHACVPVSERRSVCRAAFLSSLFTFRGKDTHSSTASRL